MLLDEVVTLDEALAASLASEHFLAGLGVSSAN